jgi:ubiquinone/menaquinone biosynthesis C-methylase UbiE
MFNGLVNLYDETRTFDNTCFNLALDYIATTFPISNYSRIIEPGIGSGRISIPIAKLGYKVMGVDLSDEMLFELMKRMRQSPPKQSIYASKADICKLPFVKSSFDLAIVVHVFYFILDWKNAAKEIFRVIRENGAIILMHTGMGAEIPFINERYKDLCQSLNSPIPTMGVHSTKEVVDYYVSLGCGATWVRDLWKWTSRNTLGSILNYLRRRAYSFTTFASESVHNKVMNELEAELISKYKSMETIIDTPNQIYLAVLTKPK